MRLVCDDLLVAHIQVRVILELIQREIKLQLL